MTYLSSLVKMALPQIKVIHTIAGHNLSCFCLLRPSFIILTQHGSLAGNDPKWAWRGQVFKISDIETNRKLLETTAGLHVSIFVFGYPVEKNSHTGYILNFDGDYSFYKPRQWNHLCFAWSSGGPSKVMLVGRIFLKYSLKNFSF